MRADGIQSPGGQPDSYFSGYRPSYWYNDMPISPMDGSINQPHSSGASITSNRTTPFSLLPAFSVDPPRPPKEGHE
jgi:hypothetical protein